MIKIKKYNEKVDFYDTECWITGLIAKEDIVEIVKKLGYDSFEINDSFCETVAEKITDSLSDWMYEIIGTVIEHKIKLWEVKNEKDK